MRLGRAVLACVVSLLVVPVPARAAAPGVPDAFRVETLFALEFPSAVAFTPRFDRTFVNERHGDLLVGTYGEQAIHHLSMSDDGLRVERDETWAMGESIVALASVPDGAYYTTPEAVKRIRPAESTPSASPPSSSPSSGGGGGGGGGGALPPAIVGGLLAGGLGVTLALLARRGRG